VLGFSFMVAIFWLLRNKPPNASTNGSASCSFCRLPGTVWATVATTLENYGIAAGALYSAQHMSAYTEPQLDTITGPSSSPPILPSLWERTSAVGGSFTPWDRASQTEAGGRFCAETAGPCAIRNRSGRNSVSTTHTITARLWRGSHNRLSAVRWGIARKIVTPGF
jgi:hypothetical protein